jgi:anti-sigma regulatory factor (Ser/Thr protein kinase)
MAPGDGLRVRAAGTFKGWLPGFREVRAWAEAFAAGAGADRPATLRLVLVLEELFTNTVAHGYATGAEGPIWVTLAGRPGLIEVTYEDAGPPFDPFTDPPAPRAGHRAADELVGGVGLALVRGLTTSARYARIGDRNRITLDVPTGDPASPAPA